MELFASAIVMTIGTHLISSSTPPSVTAQAREMVADFAISNSNYDMYPPGHALYEWAQQQLGRPPIRLDEPQLKRRAMADPRSKSSQPQAGSVSKLTAATRTICLAVHAGCSHSEAACSSHQDVSRHHVHHSSHASTAKRAD